VIYGASHDDCEDSYLLTGFPHHRARERALDTACGLYLGNPPPET